MPEANTRQSNCITLSQTISLFCIKSHLDEVTYDIWKHKQYKESKTWKQSLVFFQEFSRDEYLFCSL